MHDAALALHNLSFTWPGQTVATLDINTFDVAAGEHIFMSGPSGSGKSTLLGIISGMMLPNTGTVAIAGTVLSTLPASQRDQFRVDHIGFIFQQFNLIPYLSMQDNVILPCQFSAARTARVTSQGQTVQQAAQTLLARLDLAPTLWTRPVTTLSIGQQQRVAAARALIGSPPIIIADEPTSALDSDRQQVFLDLLQQQCAQTGATLLFISHDTRLAGRFHRHVALSQINRAKNGEKV